MAKQIINKSYTSGLVFFDDDTQEWIIEEIKKDETKRYSLTKLLQMLDGCEDVSIAVKVGSDLVPDAE